MRNTEETSTLLGRMKQVADRLKQPFAWGHIVQACLFEAHRSSPYGREIILPDLISEIDQRILQFLAQPLGEEGLDGTDISSIAAGLAAYGAARPAPAWAKVPDLLLRWVASGTAQPGDWTLEQVLAIFKRFGLREGCFDGTLVWPSQVRGVASEIDQQSDWRAQLDELVGLQTIKDEVSRLRNFLTVFQERKKRGLPAGRPPLHQVFFGNPGTGKTTIARVLSQIYREFGFLEKGQLVETDRSGLVGSVIGETEAKTTAQIQKALGGVLFIDEAYSLATDSQQDFGQRAIDTLVKAMEDYRDRLVVIVAGYEVEMGRFLDANPGLYGRFNRHLRFPDYSADELLEVFRRFAARENYQIDEGTLVTVSGVLAQRKARLGRRFGNARDARTLWEICLQWQATRLCTDPDALPLLPTESLLQVLPADVPTEF